MDVLRVQAALLRANMPDLVLRPGLMLPAKVLERAGRHGLLLLAGTPLSAELPDELQAGARLRLPGGRQAEVRVTDRAEERRGSGEPASVALAYDSPALGTLDLRLVLAP